MTLLKRLRMHTHSIHQRTERMVQSAQLMRSDCPITHYAKLLRAQYLFHATLEQAIERWHPDLYAHPTLNWNARTKKDQLAQDLALLGLPTPEVEHLDLEHPLRKKDFIIGVLYVSEGSMKGAKYISKALQKNQKIVQSQALNFYNSYENQQLWQDFEAFIHEIEEEISLFQAVRGAGFGFRMFQNSWSAVEDLSIAIAS